MHAEQHGSAVRRQFPGQGIGEYDQDCRNPLIIQNDHTPKSFNFVLYLIEKFPYTLKVAYPYRYYSFPRGPLFLIAPRPG
jgi:hypothetical protein